MISIGQTGQDARNKQELHQEQGIFRSITSGIIQIHFVFSFKKLK